MSSSAAGGTRSLVGFMHELLPVHTLELNKTAAAFAPVTEAACGVEGALDQVQKTMAPLYLTALSLRWFCASHFCFGLRFLMCEMRSLCLTDSPSSTPSVEKR